MTERDTSSVPVCSCMFFCLHFCLFGQVPTEKKSGLAGEHKPITPFFSSLGPCPWGKEQRVRHMRGVLGPQRERTVGLPIPSIPSTSFVLFVLFLWWRNTMRLVSSEMRNAVFHKQAQNQKYPLLLDIDTLTVHHGQRINNAHFCILPRPTVVRAKN